MYRTTTTTKLHVDIKYVPKNAIAISHFGAKALAEIKYIFSTKVTSHQYTLFISFSEKEQSRG